MPKRNRARERAREELSAPELRQLSLVEGQDRAGPPGRVPSGVVNISTPDEARALAHRLLTPGRVWPVVVVTLARGETEPYIDADAIKSQIDEFGEVVVLRTQAASWSFAENMPTSTQVYGGAGRVYRVDHEWVTDPYASPIRFVQPTGAPARAVDMLVADALAGALRAGLIVGAPISDLPQVSGVVRQLIEPKIAMVALDEDAGRPATLGVDVLDLGVGISRLVQVGQRVYGQMAGDTRRLEVRGMLRTTEDYLSAYAIGDVILTQVERVAADTVLLKPHPLVSVEVPRSLITDNPRDLVSDLFTRGETVLARVIATAPHMQFRLDDVDDDAHVEAQPLLEGGPPWLVLIDPHEALAQIQRVETVQRAHAGDEPVSISDFTLPTPAQAFGEVPRLGASVADPAEGLADFDAEQVSAQGSPGFADEHHVSAAKPAPMAPLFRASALDNQVERHEIAEHKETIRQLRHQLNQSERTLARREAELTSQKAKYRDADSKRQGLTKILQAQKSQGSGSATHRSGQFADPIDQFRHEVYVEWVERVPAGQKEELPLAEYVVGLDFLPSLATVAGVSREKVVAVVVEVLTGTAKNKSGRDLHRLRMSGTGGVPYVSRPEDGAAAWRVALQQGTAQARRLHYWAIGDRIELARVVLHDDMTI